MRTDEILTCGRPAPGIELRCDDIGEVWVRTPSPMTGYLGDDALTESTLVDGWLRTGDIGRLDAEGFVTIEDRKKDMVLRAGENVYCAEVEAALYEHPGVHEAAVFGVPHPRLGEEVAAAVVPKLGATLRPEELRAHVAARIAAFKVPSIWQVRDARLPRTATGKILKRALRDEVAG